MSKKKPTVMSIDTLLNEKSEHDVEYDKRLFEQYRLYVELTDRVSQRRSIANSFFITANATLITVASWFKDYFGDYMFLVSTTGILLSLFWFFCIKSYGQLNSGRFKIICEIERMLPLNLFSYEWELLGRGKSRKKYWPLARVERTVALLFITLYIVLGVLVKCG